MENISSFFLLLHFHPCPLWASFLLAFPSLSFNSFRRKTWMGFFRKKAPFSAQGIPWFIGGNSQVSVGAPAHLALAQELWSGGLCPEKKNNQLYQWARGECINRAETKKRSAASGSGDQSGLSRPWNAPRGGLPERISGPDTPSPHTSPVGGGGGVGDRMTQHFLLLLIRPTPEALARLTTVKTRPVSFWLLVHSRSV